MIVVDTSVWVDYLRQRDTEQARRLDELIVDGMVIATTGAVRMELLRGASPNIHDELRMSLDELPVIAIEDADFDAASDLFRACRIAGATVRNSIGCLIAAQCIRTGTPLLHADADFDKLATVSDLRVVVA